MCKADIDEELSARRRVRAKRVRRSRGRAKATDHAAQAAQTGATLTPTEVRKVDKEAGKITLKHEAIPNLDMPQMTMVFRVSDPKFLDKVKAGDRVLVAAEKVGGQLTVTRLNPHRDLPCEGFIVTMLSASRL